MSNRIPIIFSKSCLAMAVVALSACNSNPIQNDSTIGTVSDTLSRAGMKTRDLSSNAWDKTIYLLGFSDVNPDAPQADRKINDQLLDEVDLALLEKDAVLPPDFFMPAGDIVVVTSPDGLQTPTTFPAPFQTPTIVGLRSDIDANDFQTPTISAVELEAPAESQAGRNSIDTLDDVTTASIDDATSVILEANSNSIAKEDTPVSQYFHEVASTQTLWDIAKSTTGDANNWHTIADVNDLIQSTSVYPGQRLLIPADLVRPELQDKSGSDSKTPIDNSKPATPMAITDQPATTLKSAVASSEEGMGVPDYAPDSELESARDSTEHAEKLNIPSRDRATAEPESVAFNVGAAKDNVHLALGQGESLWDFARRTTGDATNWESIATHNGMDEAAARLVFPGQMIAVPSSMLRTDGPTSEAPKAASKPTLDSDADVASASDATPAGKTFAGELAEKSALRIVEAAYQTEPVEPMPIGSAGSASSADAETRKATRGEVIVSGTYYPKAVYHDTNFSAPLLMRVSPGTRLQVSQIDGPWLQVKTERGTGYLHQRDIR